MKINILVTGQIRSEDAFSCLLQGLFDSQDLIAEIVFSSWVNETERMHGENFDRLNARKVAVPALPVGSAINNRDISSYLAQRAQIVHGLLAFELTRHTVRLRADHDFGSPENLAQLLSLLIKIWSEPLFEDRTIVSGVDDICPYFFEDRILCMSPRHTNRLLNSNLDKIIFDDYFNLFPEYQIYSTIIDPKENVFTRHDHRHKLRFIQDGLFSNYDYLSFGGKYREYLLGYFNEVSQNILFMKDGARALSCLSDYDRLCSLSVVPRNFRIDDYDEYWETFKRSSVEYYKFLPEGVEVRDLFHEKASYNAMYVNYFKQDYASVVDSKVATGPLQLPMEEIRSVAILLNGSRNAGIQEMNRVVDAGARGFESLYYLLRELAGSGEIERFKQIAELAKVSFPHEQRMHDHIVACEKQLLM